MLADVIIFVYEVPYIFWHYINVESLSSRITLKKLLQSAMELLQISTAQFITKCDGPFLQIATAFLLQSAMDLLQIATGITKCDDYYKLRQYSIFLRERLKTIAEQVNCLSSLFL